ncbi:hypothetical protein [Psychrobacter sp. W2-37-MNA-CIBAN-0211]|uniref:hypothetical protein n=1 Tax=Psychrobacter sp. W2-37-MNA-CIBAN-0211 TaxID=3140443 RepID=UPI00331889CF
MLVSSHKPTNSARTAKPPLPITKWQLLLKSLKRLGWTQTGIGLKCGVSQATISEIRLGNTREPKHELGERLLELSKNPKNKT